jgi:hypothetical protein
MSWTSEFELPPQGPQVVPDDELSAGNGEATTPAEAEPEPVGQGFELSDIPEDGPLDPSVFDGLFTDLTEDEPDDYVQPDTFDLPTDSDNDVITEVDEAADADSGDLITDNNPDLSEAEESDETGEGPEATDVGTDETVVEDFDELLDEDFEDDEVHAFDDDDQIQVAEVDQLPDESAELEAEHEDLEPEELEPQNLELEDLEPAELEPATFEPEHLELEEQAEAEVLDVEDLHYDEPEDSDSQDFDAEDLGVEDLELEDLESADFEDTNAEEPEPEPEEVDPGPEEPELYAGPGAAPESADNEGGGFKLFDPGALPQVPAAAPPAQIIEQPLPAVATSPPIALDDPYTENNGLQAEPYHELPAAVVVDQLNPTAAPPPAKRR